MRLSLKWVGGGALPEGTSVGPVSGLTLDPKQMNQRLNRLALSFGGTLLIAVTAHGDSLEYSAMAHLSSHVPVVAGNTTLTVRSPLIGSSVTISSDTVFGPVFVGHPTLPVVCLSASRVTIATGTIDGTGRFIATVPSPTAGTTVFTQAIIQAPSGKRFGSNCVTVTPAAATAVTFTDNSSDLSAYIQSVASEDVDFADLNKDGCPDLVVATDATPVISLGNCTGFYPNDTFFLLPNQALLPTACVEVGDVNNDSWPDLFIGADCTSGHSKNLLLLNDGSGSFLNSMPAPVAGQYVGARGCGLGEDCNFAFLPGGRGTAVDAEFGDVDGDGDLDLIVTNVPDTCPGDRFNPPADPVVLYINQGGLQGGVPGRFLEKASFSTIQGNNAHADGGGDSSFGDVDNDGDLDVFICSGNTSEGGAQNQLYVNDGLGNFTDVTATALPAEPDNTFEADFGDFDNDGDLDIIAANSISSDPAAVHYYENVTTAADNPIFVDSSTNIPASFGPITNVRLGTDVGDIDCDGDLDVFIAMHELPGGTNPGPTDGETVLLLNQGGLQGGTIGTFLVDSTFTPALFVTGDVDLADIDLDGDLDVYISNTGELFAPFPPNEDQLLLNDIR